MADISTITLPTGTTYNIKDQGARDLIAALNTFEYVISTNAATTPQGVTWVNAGGTTVTGTLTASATTMYKIYLVPDHDGASPDSYTEYITINNGGTYSWERFGNTDIVLSNLGGLAYKDTASGTYTPAGTIAFTNTNKTAAVSPASSGTATYTPEGTVSQPTFSGDSLTSTGKFTPSGSINVTVNTTTKYVATSATGGGSKTAGTAASCTLPVFSTSVVNENLTLSWTAGSFTPNTPTEVTLPSFSSQTIATGINTKTFTGTEGDVSVTGTPSGTVSQPTFSGTGKRLVTGNISVPSSATFTGTQATITVS